MVNSWQGELGSSVDSDVYRKNAFDAWLAWEFLQRGVAGESTKMTPSDIAELCGKRRCDIKVMSRRALRKAEINQAPPLNV